MGYVHAAENCGGNGTETASKICTDRVDFRCRLHKCSGGFYGFMALFSPILMGLIRVLAVLTGNPLGFCVKVICHYLFHPHHGGSNSCFMARISYSNEWDTEQNHLTRIQKQPYDNALPEQECSKWKRLRGTDLPLRPDLF